MEPNLNEQQKRRKKTIIQAQTASFTCFLFYFTMKAFTMLILYSYQNTLTKDIYMTIVYLCLLVLNSYFILTTGKNPGYLLPNQQQQQIEFISESPLNYCLICKVKQKNRSKHCYQCGKCILKFDHHCPWIGACVGEFNHFRFLILLGFQSIQSIWTFNILFSSLPFHEYSGQQGDSFQSAFGAFAVFAIFMCLYAIGVLILLGFHLYLIAFNLTTRQLVSREKASYLKNIKGNPFNKGIIKNFMVAIFPEQNGNQWEVIKNTKQTSQKSWLSRIWSNQYYDCC